MSTNTGMNVAYPRPKRKALPRSIHIDRQPAGGPSSAPLLGPLVDGLLPPRLRVPHEQLPLPPFPHQRLLEREALRGAGQLLMPQGALLELLVGGGSPPVAGEDKREKVERERERDVGTGGKKKKKKKKRRRRRRDEAPEEKWQLGPLLGRKKGRRKEEERGRGTRPPASAIAAPAAEHSGGRKATNSLCLSLSLSLSLERERERVCVCVCVWVSAIMWGENGVFGVYP